MGHSAYKSYYDVNKITIWADDEGMGEPGSKRARLILGFRDGNPRIVVFTGQPGFAGVINFGMDVLTFGSVVETFYEVIDAEPGTQRLIDSIGTVYKDNKPTNETRVNSVLYIGKTKEGEIYISLIDETKPKVVFPFQATRWHKFRDGSKNELAKAEVSKKLARGFIRICEKVVANMVSKYAEDEYSGSGRTPTPIKGFEQGTSTFNNNKGSSNTLDSDVLGELNI